MRVVVETPKWGFVKCRFAGGRFVRDFVSPFPNLFNYGFVVGGVGGDGMPLDALVLGPRLRQGDEVEYTIAGYVKLIDREKQDDKVIFSENGQITVADVLKIHIFFTVYSRCKRIVYVLSGKKPNSCMYKGIIVNKSK